jgi:hypothetical protein
LSLFIKFFHLFKKAIKVKKTIDDIQSGNIISKEEVIDDLNQLLLDLKEIEDKLKSNKKTSE